MTDYDFPPMPDAPATPERKVLEADVEKEICDYAKSKGWEVRKYTSPGRKGVSDRIFINKYGVHVYIEMKRPGAKPTHLQFKHGNDLLLRNVVWRWTDNAEEGKEFIDFWDQVKVIYADAR